MNTRTKIKVIKKDAVKIIETSIAANKTPEPDDAFKLASTVSDWITEFQHRRRRETKSALERFNSWKEPDFRLQ